jgi:hypothetical protein
MKTQRIKEFIYAVIAAGLMLIILAWISFVLLVWMGME